MAVLERVVRSPEMRRERERLSARAPHIEALLKGLNLDVDSIAIARRACNRLWADRNAYDIAKRGTRLFAPAGVRLDKGDAERRLKLAIAQLEGGDQ